jgi:DNA-binding transcriptional LysR family regulator
LRLTPQAIEFAERARPLVAELRGLKAPGETGTIARFSLALADSIASSWGPAVLSSALARLPGVGVDLHSHRSVLVLESVRLGRYHIGLCTDPLADTDLLRHPIADEPMALVHARCAERADGKAPLITIEPAAASWKAIEPGLRARHARLLARPLIPVESFSAVLQMVRAGFGDGLVPLGLALEAKLERGAYRELASVRRPVALVVRKTVNQLQSFVRLRDRLQASAVRYFATSRRS